ncbi:MAG: hypothetical protein ABIP07_06975 [Sphingomicrobium sp.]
MGFVISLALWGCSDAANEKTEATPVISTPVSPESPSATSGDPSSGASVLPLPDHGYDERKGETYYYIAAVSDEDRKKGRAAGSVSAFQYLGRNGEGEHVIASLRSDGTVSYRAKCPISCRIIDTDFGEKIAFSSDSIIGAAFNDAFRGKLRIADWAKEEASSRSAKAAPVLPQTVEAITPSGERPAQVPSTESEVMNAPTSGNDSGPNSAPQHQQR